MYKEEYEVSRVIFKNDSMLFVAIPEQISQPIEIQPIEMVEVALRSRQVAAASGSVCPQRSVQSIRGTRLAPTNPVSVDTVHKETSDPTAATAQTSCVRSDLQQTRSGRWRLSAHWLQ